jgi:hypothetical protein
VNVDIHPSRIHVEEEGKEWKRFLWKQIAVRRAHRVAQVTVRHVPPVHKEKLVAFALSPAHARVEHEPFDRELTRIILYAILHTEERRAVVQFKKIHDALLRRIQGPVGRIRRGQVVQGTVFMRHAKRHRRIGERQKPKGIREMLELGGRRFEKIPPRRDVVKQVANRNRCSARRCAWTNILEVSALYADLCAHIILHAPRFEVDVRDGSDRRERLSTKTERSNPIQVLNRPNLAGGVAIEATFRVRSAHAAAVVYDLDERTPCVFDNELDGRRSGIDGVFDQLLRDRRGALNDLSSRDFICQRIRHLSNDAVVAGRGRLFRAIAHDRWDK